MRMAMLRMVMGAALTASAGVAPAQVGGPATAGNAFPGGATPNEMGAHDNVNPADAIRAADRAAMNADTGRPEHGKRSGTSGAPAQASDLTPGAAVFDRDGVALGTINRVDANGAVLATATGGQVMVPANAFGKNKHGLLLGVTKQQFDGMVSGAK